jgi:hypothetical protein
MAALPIDLDRASTPLLRYGDVRLTCNQSVEIWEVKCIVAPVPERRFRRLFGRAYRGFKSCGKIGSRYHFSRHTPKLFGSHCSRSRSLASGFFEHDSAWARRVYRDCASKPGTSADSCAAASRMIIAFGTRSGNPRLLEDNSRKAEALVAPGP